MQAAPDDYAVEHAYPIVGRFAIAIAQPHTQRQSIVGAVGGAAAAFAASGQPKRGACTLAWGFIRV